MMLDSIHTEVEDNIVLCCSFLAGWHW